MGFNCEIFSMPKYKDTTPLELDAILKYHTFNDQVWAKENFSTPAEYCLYDSELTQLPADDKINFYKEFIHKNEYGSPTISDTLEWWCSGGIPILKFLQEQSDIDNIYDKYILLSKSTLTSLLDWAWGQLDHLMPAPFYIQSAYRTSYGEDGYVEGYTVTNIDGIEVMDEEGDKYQRVYCSDETPVFISINGDEFEDYYFVYYNLIRCIEKILLEIDLDKNDIYFIGGW